MGKTDREVLNTYLDRIEETKKAGIYEMQLRAFKPFVDHDTGEGLIGEMPASALTSVPIVLGGYAAFQRASHSGFG